MCFDFVYEFVCNISHSSGNLARCHKYENTLFRKIRGSLMLYNVVRLITTGFKTVNKDGNFCYSVYDGRVKI